MMKKIPDLKEIIPLNPSIPPVQQPSRRVPLNVVPLIRQKIEELLRRDIIEEVKSSKWLSPLVPVKKADGTLRLCVDMRAANEAVISEKYPLPTLETMTAKLDGSRVFSVLDLKDAFHHVELDEQSRDITTFMDPDGRLFRYKVLMFGVRTGSEKFQKVMEQRVFKGVEGADPFIDDIIVYGKNEEMHDRRLKNVLNRLDTNQMTLNMPKCQIRQSQVVFMGHLVSQRGVEPMPGKVEAIQSFRPPKNKTELKSFLGLVLYVGAKFEPSLATATAPLRRLLVDETRFSWGASEQEAFEALKQLMKTSMLNTFYKRDHETTLFADAGPEAAGAILAQKDNEGVQRVVACASRAFSGPERNYSQLEKEALACKWSVKRFDYYLAGSKFTLVTDHKPLETLFKSQGRASARVTRWRLEIQEYDFTIKYKSGDKNIADPFSRLATGGEIGVDADEEAEEYVMAMIESNAVSMEEVAAETANDETFQKVFASLKNGFWADDEDIVPFKRCQSELSEVKGVLLRSFRIIPPSTLRKRILQAAHEGHPGIVKMKGRLRRNVWWPGIDDEVAKLCGTCLECKIVSSANPPTPMRRHALPLEAWQEVAADLMGPLPTGETLLVVIDYFSRYPEVAILEDTKAAMIIKSLQEMFARWGNPKTIRMDNGPQFACAEMKEFLKEENIRAEYSPPYWPRANGQVERMNRDLKLAIQKSLNEGKEWRQGLIEHLKMYRSSPQATTAQTPAELMFKRQMRGKLPIAEDLFETHTDLELLDRDKRLKEAGKLYGDAVTHARDDDLTVGDHVLVRRAVKASKWTPNFNPVVCEVVAKQGNKATVEAPSGKRYDRATSHLKKMPHPEETIEVEPPHTSDDAAHNNDVALNGSVTSRDQSVDEQPAEDEASSFEPQAVSTPIGNKSGPAKTPTNARPVRERKRPRALDGYELYEIEEQTEEGERDGET